MKQIFLVEDDREIAKNLTRLLETEGFSVRHAPTQAEAVQLLGQETFDLALVDISLPDGNGFTVCTQIKQAQNIPVLFLTASGDEASVVTGLNMGADDYITKPFRPRELLARIGAALRKAGQVPAVFTIQNLTVDMVNGLVKKEGRELFLSPLEYRLLLLFINNPKTILTVYIKRLREKIEDDPASPQIIRTVRGTGYRLGERHAAQ